MKLTTAGESHGKGLYGILTDVPSNFTVDVEAINAELGLRQSGYGRGGRQKIETDSVEIFSGVRNGKTLGSPICFGVKNRDYENWQPFMDAQSADVTKKRLTAVRPGHADLSGMLKYHHDDARNVLERASARETAARVAGGSICRQFLRVFGVEIASHVVSVGGIKDEGKYSFNQIKDAKSSPLFMLDKDAEKRAIAVIDQLKKDGDTAGGVIEVRVKGLKSGFGSPMEYERKLDAKLAAACMSVQAIKGVEIGVGFAAADQKGSEVHDEIFLENGAFARKTNRAGGIEGGMSNGEEIVIRAAMKPIPTLMKGLRTVDVDTMQAAKSAPERSDVTAVPACAVVLEAAVAVCLSEVVAGRLGGDDIEEMVERWNKLP